MNKYTGEIIEFHIIQSFPVSCLNRDDCGAPKSAVIGGVQRARVSSQCWKRQVRLEMHDLEKTMGIKLGVRTKRVAQMMADACREAGATEEQGQACGTVLANAVASKDTLFFVSPKECRAFAGYAKEKGFVLSQDKAVDKDLKKLAKKELDAGVDALDIALFGRMVAQAPELNVEAAAAFSHAISTHKVASEIDFFTAMDDSPEEDQAGSAHMGTLEFNAATYYRYISLDVGTLAHTLGLEADEDAQTLKKSIEAFIRALFVAVPAARQATQSAACLWDFAHVYIRHGQRLQASFEEPVRSQNGYSKPSIERLENYLKAKESLMGSMYGKKADFIWGLDPAFSIDALIDSVKEAL